MYLILSDEILGKILIKSDKNKIHVKGIDSS